MPTTLSKRTPAVKQVVCTYCDRPCEVARRAMSIFCPNCRKRLILEDFKITTYYAVREFFTCGDIVVERKGHVVAPIKAGHLTVRGKVQGKVIARDSVTIGKAGTIIGEVITPMLLVETGGKLDGPCRIGAMEV